ncbi:MAG: division/cell wall cluster transcriptional repressor MraZ [Bacteroidales bacterium]|nr:division/cell wall cluster transcriptional repressor MraZ [Bacteroidales bacterium]
MTTFIGDFTCKIDAKGRILFPSSFKKQMASASQERFVIKKEIFETCLILFPIEEWERQNMLLREKINVYNKEHNRFLREFYRGSAEVVLDSNNRLLVPKRLLDMAKINKEVVLAGQDGKIEIWAKELYDKGEMSEKDFASLAEKILGGTLTNNE